MKTLTKIKLINWHGFYNDTLDIRNAVLITGENGSGKSTLLDALYYLLTGGEEGKFNSAATERTARSLETYMRGKTGVEGKTFLRNGNNLISHIALEYFDDVSNDYLIIGVVLEIQDGKTRIGKTFYHIKRRRLSEDLFTKTEGEKVSIINFREMKRLLKEEEINVLEGGREDIRSKILTILCIENARYYELLPKALAFKPIADVNSFVYQFLMPEKPIRIENIRTQIHAYEDIQRQINEDKAKKKDLEEILQAMQNRTDSQNQADALEAVEIETQIEDAVREKEKLLATQTKNEISLNQKKGIIEQRKAELESLRDTISSIENSSQYNLIQKLESEKKGAFKVLQDREREANRFNRDLNEEQSIAMKLGIDAHFLRFLKKEDYAGLVGEISRYQPLLRERQEELTKEKVLLDEKRSRLNRERETLQNEIADLRKGVSKYPDSVASLISLLTPIVKEVEPDARPIPLCELLDIDPSNEPWRNAIESSLGNNRFALFVPESSFQKCLNVFEGERLKGNAYDIPLVNLPELRECETDEMSLAKKLSTEDTRARKYIDALLGKVIAASEYRAIFDSPSAYSSDMGSHRDFGILQVGPNSYRYPYIGRESRIIRIAALEKNLEEVRNALLDTENDIREVIPLLHAISGSHFQSHIPEADNDVWGRLAQARDEYEAVSEQLEAAKDSYGSLVPDIDELRAKADGLRHEINALDDEVDRISRGIGRIDADIESCSARVAELEETRGKMILTEEASLILSHLKSEPAMPSEKLRLLTKRNRDNAAKLATKVVLLMSDYIGKYGFDAVADLDSFKDFELEYNDVVLRDLDKHLARVEEVKKKTAETFQNAYIHEISKLIRTEEASIKKLNAILESKPFGHDGDVYRFIVGKSKDEAFGRYYDIFKSNQDYNPNDLFTELLEDKNLALMQDLFRELTQDSDDPRQLKLINAYTDYRSFMSYDIQITNKYGDISYFSKINKEKSGGETQTPFYVIIAASFDQIIHGGYGQQSTGCILMLDEAFNNMDESHIDSMMRYFQQLDIQPIISVPTQKAQTIMPYVDTTYGLIKINNRVYPRALIKEENQ